MVTTAWTMCQNTAATSIRLVLEQAGLELARHERNVTLLQANGIPQASVPRSKKRSKE